MVNQKDVIYLNISEINIKEIIKEVLLKNFNKIDNIRNRNSNIQFDCLLKGYVGERALTMWFKEHGIEFSEVNYKNTEENIDIDLLFNYGNNDSKTIEVKTSLIPSKYFIRESLTATIKKCIENLDIKLIRRGNQKIEDLKGDIHIQIYFLVGREERDKFLNNLKISIKINSETIEDSFNILIDKIYNLANLKCYQNMLFIGWIDKKTLITQINQKPFNERIWTFSNSKRTFWKCNIKREAKPPIDILEYLKNSS